MKTITRFKGLPVLRKTTADKINLPPVLIFQGEFVQDGTDHLGLPKWKEAGGMEEYSGWGYSEHLRWVKELTKLDIPYGSIIATDEHCTEVWLLAKNHYKTTCRLVYKETRND